MSAPEGSRAWFSAYGTHLGRKILVTRPDSRRVAAAHLLSRGHHKEAGEVIFKKDRSGDVGSWAYADVAPSKREIPGDFNYSPRNQKPLAKVMRSTLAALGHTLAAYNRFARLKSARLSPDGNLGGRGYIQKIQDMRKQYMNCVEAMSALSDTLYDEINAPHWSVLSRQEDAGDKAEVEAIIDDSETIRQDPEEWADKEIKEEFGEEEQEQPSEIQEMSEDTEDTEDAWEDWGEPASEKRAADVESWLDPAVFGKTARVTARDIRLSRAVERVAKVWTDKLPGGLADKKKPSDFDSGQLAKGVKIEMEHTDNREKAREIAMDHLQEDPNYYDKLETIEGEHR
jgi:hypothetical protein